jgi:hypothetical protein
VEYELRSLFAGGKSAILAGIAVGLGGKALATGRGTGVTSLIQEGKKYAWFSFWSFENLPHYVPPHLVVKRK